MDSCVRLSASETAAGHPFTDPDRSGDDLVVINQMASRLRLLVSEPGTLRERPRPLVLNLREIDGRRHRVVICNEELLHAGDELSLVGFFAQKRLDMDGSPLTATDRELIRELPGYPGILSYSSLEFPDGNWGNLVLVSPPEAKDHWLTSETHAYAARELAPRHYTVIRLHNGVLPGGLLSGRDPILVRTKYYDFQGPGPWQAERAIRPTRPGATP